MTKFLLALLLPVSAFAAPQGGVFPIRGSAAAPVKVIMYGDFQCPYTKRAAQTLADLQAEMPDKFSIVFRNYPLSFHPLAKPAALTGVCVQNLGDFWNYYDRVFAVNSGQLTAEIVEQSAIAAGADKSALQACVSATETEQRVQRDIEEGELLNVSGTPYLYLVGPTEVKKVAGAYPKEEMKKFIEEVK